MKIVDKKLHCPQCDNDKTKEDFHWNKLGQKAMIQCKECLAENRKKKKLEREFDRQFCII